ncbi:hypothetical protein JHK87_010019 [Glycine soja]|nr:hypothetical protein JHK87_010019 [Glycine soja]
MSSRSASTPSRTLGGALVPTESQSFSTSKAGSVHVAKWENELNLKLDSADSAKIHRVITRNSQVVKVNVLACESGSLLSICNYFMPLPIGLVDALKTELEKFYGKNSLESKDLSRVVNSNHFNQLIKLLDDGKVDKLEEIFDMINLGSKPLAARCKRVGDYGARGFRLTVMVQDHCCSSRRCDTFDHGGMTRLASKVQHD